MESVYTWDESGKNEDFRGATGGGDGVHILSGPIHVRGAMPGDLLKVEILDLYPRKNPDGKTFGSNAAAWWGFQARVNKVNGEPFYAGSFSNTPDKSDEVVVRRATRACAQYISPIRNLTHDIFDRNRL